MKIMSCNQEEMFSDGSSEVKVYRETFSEGPGGWFAWDARLSPIEIQNGMVVSRSPWWIDPNHAPPGAGYLHILMALYTLSKPDEEMERVTGRNKFVEMGFPQDFTNAKVTVKVRGEVNLRGAEILFLAQAAVGGKAINFVLTAQPIEVTPNWSTQTITLDPDESQWTCLGSRLGREDTYGWGPIAPVLKNLNLDILFVLFPIIVNPVSAFDGDKDRAVPHEDYEADRSRLPQGTIWFDEVSIEFPAR